MNEKDIENLKARGQKTIDLRKSLIEIEKEQRQVLVTFSFTFGSILAVLAGFGFTAFSFIKDYSMFFAGEFLVIAGLFYLGFRTKNMLAGWAVGTSNQIYELESEAAQIKEAIIKNDVQNGKRLAKEFEDAVMNTAPNPRIIQSQPINSALTVTFWVALVGIALILISFTCI